MNQKTTWLLVAMAIAFGCLIGFFQIHNPDVWWHIAWGEKIWEHLKNVPAVNFSTAHFPTAEDFYFTPTSSDYLRDLPNTFLGDIVLALIYKHGGVLALQLLVVLFLFLGGAFAILLPFGKEIFQNKNKKYFALLLFFGFCLGTSQLQLVRNSLVSLLLFPLVLGLYSWHARYGGWRIMLVYPAIFVTWSFIHSSYILGIIALLLLYAGLFLNEGHFSNLKNNKSFSRLHAAAALVVLLVTMSISLTYSWQARQLLSAPITHAWKMMSSVVEKTKQDVVKKEDTSSSSTKAQSNDSVAAAVVKPLWSDTSKSGDFISTWKILYHPAAWSSLLISFVALLLLLTTRAHNKIGMFLLVALTTYFGISYFRGTGYATIAATFAMVSLFSTTPLAELKNKFSATCAKIVPLFAMTICSVLLLASFYLAVAHKSEFFFKERGRIFAVGKAALFEDTMYDFVKTHFNNEPCFTTMMTGSYALVNWQDEKKVFIDAFFAPHSKTLWDDYSRAQQQRSLSFLDHYGIQNALVENSRADWQSLFLTSPDWQPAAIGLGTTLYAKENENRSSCEVLFNLADVERMPSPTARHAVAAAFYNTLFSLQLHKKNDLAHALVEEHMDLFKNLVRYLYPSQRANIRQEPPGIKPELLAP